jgi:FkbM family methyltransferase
MHFNARAQNFAAKFGLHVDRLSRQPKIKMLGLVNRPIELILDVGANEGQFAQEMRARFPGAHIVSFEPNPGVFSRLNEWCKGDGNARAYNCAIGEAEGVLEMNVHVDHTASSSLLATSAHEEDLFPQTKRQQRVSVQVRRLDDILEDEGIVVGPSTFLKFDIQGFEEAAMRGAPKTLAGVGAMMTEVFLENLYEGQADFLNLGIMARDAGLRYAGNLDQIIGAEGQVMWLDALYLRALEQADR